jgi:hypothetical protein
MEKNPQTNLKPVPSGDLVTEQMLENLPPVVRKHLQFTGAVGCPRIKNVRLEQSGIFRMDPEKPWMPFTAVQTYSVNPPSLEWKARFKLAGLPLMRGQDRYESGHGHMYGKLAGLFTVFDARGEELDQATRIRFLNEIMWFPTAYLEDYITWEQIDDRSARVTFTDHEVSVSGVMHFAEDGRLKNFTCLRYRENQGEYSLDPWSTPITGYKEMAGLNLPLKGKAVWNLPDGDMPYAELEIRKIDYNLPA